MGLVLEPRSRAPKTPTVLHPERKEEAICEWTNDIPLRSKSSKPEEVFESPGLLSDRVDWTSAHGPGHGHACICVCVCV